MSVTLNPGSGVPWWVSSPGISLGHFGSASDAAWVRYWSLRVGGTVYRTTVPLVGWPGGQRFAGSFSEP